MKIVVRMWLSCGRVAPTSRQVIAAFIARDGGLVTPSSAAHTVSCAYDGGPGYAPWAGVVGKAREVKEGSPPSTCSGPCPLLLKINCNIFEKTEIVTGAGAGCGTGGGAAAAAAVGVDDDGGCCWLLAAGCCNNNINTMPNGNIGELQLASNGTPESER